MTVFPVEDGDGPVVALRGRARELPGDTWDFIIGLALGSAIETLVERTTRYLMLVHLPDGHRAEGVRDGLVKAIATLPEHLRRSPTWGQGTEMLQHREV